MYIVVAYILHKFEIRKGDKMKKTVEFIQKTLYNTAAVYLLISCLIFVVFFTVSELDPASSGAITIQLYSLAFSFVSSLVLSVSGLFRKVPAAIKRVCEFVLLYAAFYYCFFGLTGNAKNFTAVFALSTVFAAVYFIVLAICAIAGRLKREKEEYVNIYSENSSENK